MSLSSLVLWVLLPVTLAQGIFTTRPKSCLGSGRTTAAPDRQLVFDRVYAQFDQGQQYPGDLAHGTDLSRLPTLRNSEGAVLTGFGDVLRLVYTGTTVDEAQGYSNDTEFLSTIVLDTDILSFPVSRNTTSLCSSIRTSQGNRGQTENGGTVITDSGCPYSGDIALGVSIPLTNSYALTTISTELLVLDPSNQALHLACYEVQVTPYYPSHWVYALIRYVIIGILSMYLFLYVLARVWSSYTNWLHDNETHLASSLTLKLVTTSTPLSRRKMWGAVWFNAWAGRLVVNSGSLRRYVTAEFRELFTLVMWFSMVGIVAVDWPGFAYPVFAQTAWTTLIYNNTLPFTSLPAPLLPNNFTAPSLFAEQMNDITSPLYLDDSVPNVLLDVESSDRGIERWARTVGVRKEDLWSTCAFTFFVICAAIVAAHLVFFAFDTLLDIVFPSRFSKRRLRAQAKARQDNIDDLYEAGTRMSMKEARSSETSAERQTARGGSMGRNDVDFGDDAYMREDDDSDEVGPQRPEDDFPSWRLHLALLQGNLIRVLFLFHLPLSTFSVYTFATKSRTPDSTLRLAVVTFAVVCVAIPAYLIWQLHRVPGRELYSSLSRLLSVGVLYNTMSDECVLFSGVRLVANLIVAIMLGAVQGTGTAQAATILLVEVADTLITSLWLPWGDNAAMGPLAFILCLARIVIAVLLVVLSPTVAVAAAAAAWIAYIVLLIQGLVLLMLLVVLAFKFFELLIRIVGGVPFDESRSSRSGGLGGALRKWDRGGQGKSHRKGARRGTTQKSTARVNRATGDLRRTGHRGPSETTVGTHTRLLDSQSANASTFGYKEGSHGSRQRYQPTSNEDDGFIMSAMSSGPWTSSSPGYVKPGAYSSGNTPTVSAPAATSGPVLRSGPTWGDTATIVPAAVPSSASTPGFARIGGGRASSSNPYQVATMSASANAGYPPYPSSSADGYQTGVAPPGNPRRLSQSAIVEMAGPGSSADNFAPMARNTSRMSLGAGGIPALPPSSALLLSNTVTRPSPTETARPGQHAMTSSASATGGFFGRFRRARPPMSDYSSDEDDSEDDDEHEAGRKRRFGGLRWLRAGRMRDTRSEDENELEQEDEVPPAERGFVVTRKPRPGPPPGVARATAAIEARTDPTTHDDEARAV